MSTPRGLPIEEILPQIIDSLTAEANLLIEAPPGAGKTTRVPPAVIELSSDDAYQPYSNQPLEIQVKNAVEQLASNLSGNSLPATVSPFFLGPRRSLSRLDVAVVRAESSCRNIVSAR